MAIVKFYDAMGSGAYMADPTWSYTPNDGSTILDGAPYISQYDWNTICATFSFNSGSKYLAAYLSEISNPYYLIESLYYYDSNINSLASFYGVNIQFNINDDFSSGAFFTNMFSGDDDFEGNIFADYLRSGGGNDILRGLSGNDTLDGGFGADTMLGGSGNDIYYVDNFSDWVIETTTATSTTNAGGIDKVNSSISFNLSAYTGVSFVENLTLTGSSAINGTGNALANTLVGNSAANTLNGSTGADIMLGGAGNDTYYVDNIGDKVCETTTTTSTINAGGTDTVISSVTFSLNVTGATYVENLRLNSANAINGTGNALNNTIFAGAGNNTIDGLGGTADTVSYVYATAGVTVDLRNVSTAQATVSSGSDLIKNVENLTGSNFNDTLRGNTGANTLIGNAGVDTLYGYEANDLLRGGAGNDVLYGGTGQDLFRFDTALSTSTVQNLDQIKDFSVVDDTIQLENSIFTKFGTTTTGTINSAYFKANTTGLAADSNDYIVYETDTGKLFYDADGSGAGASIQIATLGTNLALTNSNFYLV